MKKILIIGSFIISICTNGFAGTEIWFSGNKNQVILIQLEAHHTKAKAWIMPDSDPISKWKATGINIKNCGGISHVDPGNVAVCDLSIQNPVISFSSDKSTENFAAFGSYTYQDRD